eukprot:gnl/TRDRNA2_/TRDRNA2_69705_c0_seq1.p1 gnl/TRDRNA2_/TRDRNA2_69705_c0~~gnl/TRDRNA2_/TRDRNA2_69705_c0_seq1.p1  ORF type:complete len:118 (-),score=4.69 gnl/TRDRNA2_/TRDRNA2_69705_c0_seq1:559-912(-)
MLQIPALIIVNSTGCSSCRIPYGLSSACWTDLVKCFAETEDCQMLCRDNALSSASPRICQFDYHIIEPLGAQQPPTPAAKCKKSSTSALSNFSQFVALLTSCSAPGLLLGTTGRALP